MNDCNIQNAFNIVQNIFKDLDCSRNDKVTKCYKSFDSIADFETIVMNELIVE